MSTPGITPSTNFQLTKKFLADQADASLDVTAPGAPSLMNALRSPDGKIPAGDIVIGDIQAKAGGDGSVAFGGSGTPGKVTFTGHLDAAFRLGIYADPKEAIKALAPSPELADGVTLKAPESTRYVVLRAAYDVGASAKGSVALGAGASATFGVSGSSSGVFAVLHRFHDQELALQVFRDTFRSWALPIQIGQADDLAPGTWVIAEVDGSFAVQIGAQAGYDFSWIRELPDGALKGDIGLRVQLGASAAFGFEASGKYAVVLGREGSDKVVRLRLYKLAKKGWNFALDARVGIKAELPPFFDQPHKAEDLVAAIFGLNENQIIDVLRETRAFVNSTVSLQDKLAGVIMDLGGTAIEKAGGLSAQQIQDTYEAGRKRLLDLLDRFDDLQKNGGHELTSMLLSLGGPQSKDVETVLRAIAGKGNDAEVQELIGGLLSKAGFERQPIARFIEAAVGPALGVLSNTEQAKQLQSIAGQALAVLDGGALQQVLEFIRAKIHLDQVRKVVTETDFNTLDNLLKDRLAAFLGKQTATMDDLQKIQVAIQNVFANVDKFYSMALQTAKKNLEFSLTASYARSTTKTALVDLSFDLSKDNATEFLRNAVDGNFNKLLLEEVDGVKINAAELTHNIQRNVSSELTMPFGSATSSAETLSSAKLTVAQDDGRVLLYTLDAHDATSDRSLFGARNGRDSTLTVAASLPLGVAGGVKTWKDSTFTYSYRMERAVMKMRSSQMLREIGPLVQRYIPSAFSGPGERTFEEFVTDLDKALDSKDPHSGTHDIGDTLVTLDVTAPSAYLFAWNKAPLDRKDAAYANLSRALQAKLKELVTFYYFSDPSRYATPAAAAPAIVFSCMPPTTTIKLNGDNEVAEFNTDKDYHWDQTEPKEISAVATARPTVDAVAKRLQAISDTLRGIPELAGSARFYNPDQVDDIIHAALTRTFPSSPRPELLGSLLDLEVQLIKSAAATGIELARFRQTAGTNPAEALKHLAQFGEDLAKTFNEVLGHHPFLSGASRPLGTLLFLEAAASFDPAVRTISVDSLMNITVIQSGKLSLDDMLSGKIKDENVLFEQPLLQSN